MNTQPAIIGIKELHRKLSDVTKATAKGHSFIVFKHTTPVFRIEPVSRRKAVYTLDDLKKIRFKSHNPKLSQDIDSVVW